MIKYSVIIPVYGDTDLRPVLYSLVRQSVSKKNFEVIIVDDGTPLSIRRDYDALRADFSDLFLQIVLCTQNQGPASARNLGIKRANGDIIFFTDDDCELPADWIARHVAVYRKHPEVSMVGGWYLPPQLKLRNNIFYTFQYLSFLRIVHSGIYVSSYVGISSHVRSEALFPAANTANLSVLKAVALSTGGFNQAFVKPCYEDVEFSWRLRRSGFVLHFIPMYVIHHKEQTLFSFIRFVKTRALGIHVLLYLTNNGLRQTWGQYRDGFFTSTYQSSILRRLSRRKAIFLWLLAYFHWWYQYSSILYWHNRRRWLKYMYAQKKL